MWNIHGRNDVTDIDLLLNLVLHGGHSIFLWQQNLVSGTAEVTQHIISLVV